MERFLIVGLIALMFICSGCGTTEVFYFDKDGKIERQEVKRGIVGDIMDEMKNKNVVWWSDRVFAGIEFKLTGSETYLPTGRIVYYNGEKGHASLLPETTADQLRSMAKLIEASKLKNMEIEVDQKGAKLKHTGKND